ncbi:DUF6320 domain-containing protein [Paramaledivibacter caminithermalis]|jgi:hypothetical protein|uniref:Uncharacterized protein n=1 Tax=Paramaledivibacter caminithermalis (strain DSM 15212 / CIP 107654 / DViRD3) TaxID=1121301 RepID=A0A1M6P3S8_PARC5|nr:DUF6320 domain-containing protein [Paramaledivibacter caminithermalis]SHK02639.1 hypothetical protein SAMN02745912_02005 [Paramaledivibacter caminithermalis DSM 15212]
MPYCSKCGVEVDYNIKKCPLCDFPIPPIEPEEKEEDRFPSPQNSYPNKVKKRKRRAFIIISVILLTTIELMLFQNFSIEGKLTWSKYSVVSIVASWIYLFFLFRFIPRFRISVIGISITTIIFLYILDILNGRLDWFILIGLPCTIMGALTTIIFAYLFKKSKRKGLNIVSYILMGLTLYCIVIEVFISLHIRHFVTLYWSIIVALALLPISILFLYLHYGLPEKYKIKLERKFHI